MKSTCICTQAGPGVALEAFLRLILHPRVG